VVRTLSRGATSTRLAAVRRSACGFKLRASTFDPREEPGALAAPAGFCAGAESNLSCTLHSIMLGRCLRGFSGEDSGSAPLAVSRLKRTLVPTANFRLNQGVKRFLPF
jgi:hypothetical protein